MHYLECIALLNYLLRKLCAGQRMQVPATVAEEVQQTVIAVNKRLPKDAFNETMRANDIMDSISVIKSTDGLVYLTEQMKNTLIDGITELCDGLCLRAFTYFQTNDFEPTEEMIKIMRNVVSVALEKGVI